MKEITPTPPPPSKKKKKEKKRKRKKNCFEKTKQIAPQFQKYKPLLCKKNNKNLRLLDDKQSAITLLERTTNVPPSRDNKICF